MRLKYSLGLTVVAWSIVMSTGTSRANGNARGVGPPKGTVFSLVLQKSDLPSGFKLIAGFVLTNSSADQLAQLKPGTSARSGRVNGYQEDFQRKAKAGLIEVRNLTTAYKTAANAHDAFTGILRHPQKGGLPGGQHIKSISGLGNEADEYAYPLPALRGGIAVLFRRGRYVVEITGAGIGSAFHPAQVVALAHIVDGRIVHAGS
jgi:hypothetical protein